MRYSCQPNKLMRYNWITLVSVERSSYSRNEETIATLDFHKYYFQFPLSRHHVPCALCMYLHWRCVHLSAFRFQSLAFIFHVKNCAKCFGRNPLIFNSKNLMFVDSVEIMYVYWRRRHTHVLQRCRRKSFDVNTLSSMCQSVICPFAFSHVTFTSRVHANIVCKHTLHRTDSAAWRSRCWKRHQMPSQN